MRRRYLLLEVMIAMLLVATVSPLIIRSCHLSIERKRRIESELSAARTAPLALGVVQEMLYTEEIKWRSLCMGEKRQHKARGRLDPLLYDFPTKNRYEIGYLVEIVDKKFKPKTDNQPSSTWRLLRVLLTFTPKRGEVLEYDYLLMVQRLSPRKNV